jgi:hypothetical protein
MLLMLHGLLFSRTVLHYRESEEQKTCARTEQERRQRGMKAAWTKMTRTAIKILCYG